jgi:hypothetical protein
MKGVAVLMTREIRLDVQGLSKRDNELLAANNISFHVNKVR